MSPPIDSGKPRVPALLFAATILLSAFLLFQVQPLIAKVKRAADDEIDKLDEKHLDAELEALKAKVPSWKAEGADALDHRLGTVKSRIAKIEDDLRRSNRAGEARKLKEKFDKWLDEVQR